jgi:hypothetical protein
VAIERELLSMFTEERSGEIDEQMQMSMLQVGKHYQAFSKLIPGMDLLLCLES